MTHRRFSCSLIASFLRNHHEQPIGCTALAWRLETTGKNKSSVIGELSGTFQSTARIYKQHICGGQSPEGLSEGLTLASAVPPVPPVVAMPEQDQRPCPGMALSPPCCAGSILLSLCPHVPLSCCPRVLLSLCPSVPLSLCPAVLMSLCPSVPYLNPDLHAVPPKPFCLPKSPYSNFNNQTEILGEATRQSWLYYSALL